MKKLAFFFLYLIATAHAAPMVVPAVAAAPALVAVFTAKILPLLKVLALQYGVSLAVGVATGIGIGVAVTAIIVGLKKNGNKKFLTFCYRFSNK